MASIKDLIPASSYQALEVERAARLIERAAKAPFIPTFPPHPWQIEPYQDTSPVLLFTGSAGGGKSRLAAEMIYKFCKLHPGATTLALRKIRESTKNSIVLFLERVIIKNDPDVHHNKGDRRFEFSNGSVLIYAGMKDEFQREQIRSAGVEGGIDFVWMEEATQFEEDDYNELLARMRGRAASYTQIVLTTNPDSPAHWIAKRLIEGGEAKVYRSSAADNPSNPKSYIEILSKLTGVLYDRLVLGLWKQAQGAVYSEYDVAIHVLKNDPPGGYAYFVAGADWGYTHPGVMSVYGVDSDGRLYLVYEIYYTGQLVGGVNDDGWWVQRAKEIQRRFQIRWMACDPAEPAYIETLKRAGIRAEPANNEIAAGVQRVKQRLALAADGKPRLYFKIDALQEADPALEAKKQPVSTLQEITLYAYPKGKSGVFSKEIPEDAFNHGMDVLRYVVARADSISGIGIARL